MECCLEKREEHWERLQNRDLSTAELRFFRHVLMFQHGGFAGPAVTTEFMLLFRTLGEESPFGSYKFSVRLDGRTIGGYLVMFPQTDLEHNQ